MYCIGLLFHFCCCHNKLPFNLAALKNTNVSLDIFLAQSLAGAAVSSVWGLTRPKSRCLWGCILPCRLWAKVYLHACAGCWLHSVPCGCRTEVLRFLLAVSQVPGFLLEGRLHSSSCSSHGTPPQQWWVHFLTYFESFQLPSCCISLIPVRESSLLLRTHVIRTGPSG